MHFKNYFQVYRGNLPGVPDLEESSKDSPVTWLKYRLTLKPKYSIVWRDIILCYLLVLAGIIFLFYFQFKLAGAAAFITTAVLGLWIGYWFHSLSLFLHEAAHFNIHPNPKWNDILADLVIGFWFIRVRDYRAIHWRHHLFLGTPGDPEASYFNAPTFGFLIQMLTGIHNMKTILRYSGTGIKSVKKKNLFIRLFFIHGGIVGATILLGYYWFTLGWLLGFLVFFPLWATLRQILRHRDERADPQTDYSKLPHGPVLRYFGNDIFSRTFGNAGFNVHMFHHWDPYISYTRLDDMAGYFKKTSLHNLINDSQTAYWSLFWKFLRKKRLP